MTDHSASDDAIPDDSVFEHRLQELLIQAYRSDVEVAGGWECRNHDDGVPDWDVTVTELEKPAGE